MGNETAGQGSETGKEYPFSYRGGFDLPLRRPPDERLIQVMARGAIRLRQARLRRQMEYVYFEQFKGDV